MNTNRWMQEVNARFPVRKSKAQKERRYSLGDMPVSSLNARLNVRTLSKPQPRAISCIPLFVNANWRMAAVTRRLFR